MDVRRGHCWRCEALLGNTVLPCKHCGMAEYCSSSCHNKDQFRHVAVECQVFGPKRCSNCGKIGHDVIECERCNKTWYCNEECQRNDRRAHAHSCQAVVQSMKSVARGCFAVFNSKNPVPFQNYYFGNTIVKDFLNIEDNEWSGGKTRGELARNFHVLSAGCSDLRNTVLTAGSLPAEYTGKVHITLNDLDPFVMARNVLFLYMLVRFADTDGIESSLASIWYSLHIKRSDYDLIKTSLDELIPMDAKDLRDATKGLVSSLDEDLQYMSQVWVKWRSLQCQRDHKTSINLRKQRKALFNYDMITTLASLQSLYQIPENKKQMEIWFEDGLFLPNDAKQDDLPFDNPTLTGKETRFNPVTKTVSGDFDTKPPKDFAFVYPLLPVDSPFGVWDYLRVKESQSRPGSSPMVMYHSYVTSLLHKVKLLILQGRLQIHVSLANCLDFPNHHTNLKLPDYDRIFTSNLVDYLSFAKILKTFKPLLNRRNPFSAIVTETMNWFQLTPRANVKDLEGTLEYKKCYLQYAFDARTKEEMAAADQFNDLRLNDYYNSTSCFLEFLKGNIMAGEIATLENVPSLSFVKTFHGMQMRDFRTERNRLVPFLYSQNRRELTLIKFDRAVEWCLPSTSGRTNPLKRPNKEHF